MQCNRYATLLEFKIDKRNRRNGQLLLFAYKCCVFVSGKLTTVHVT